MSPAPMIADTAIRLAVPADAAAIAAMSRDTIEQGLPWGWRPARVARSIAHPDTNVAVIGAPGAIVAFGIMSYLENVAHLLLFAVHPGHRRQGLGSALLLWLEDVARAAGSHRIRVEARRDNAAARDFYGAHGYHERAIRPGMYREDVDGLQLEKWLRARD